MYERRMNSIMDVAAAESLRTAYSVMLLDDYTHTLDILPTDLSRQFADLRELDAVLSSAVQLLTAKIDAFLLLLATPHGDERGSAVRDRQKLLGEIADDAARLKLGCEDKIRVACQAADQLRAHRDQIALELGQIPTFDTAALGQKTVYPHISDRTYPPLNYNDGNSRRRRTGNLLANLAGEGGSAAASKRKRQKDDDDQGGQRYKPSNRARKPERAASPTESILSVASHHQAAASSSTAPRNNRYNGAKPKANARPPVPPGAFHPSLHHSMAWADGRLLAGPGVAAPSTPQPEPAQNEDGAEVDERIYCICKQQSYGDMIACDADDCDKEWYHLVCVGLTVAPEGKWICDECLSKQQKNRNGQRSRNTNNVRKSGGGGSARNGRGDNFDGLT